MSDNARLYLWCSLAVVCGGLCVAAILAGNTAAATSFGIGAACEVGAVILNRANARSAR